MGKMTGFLDYERTDNEMVSPENRLKNFAEFHIAMDEEKRCEQAARCMNCGVPLCQSAIKLSGMITGCPLHNLIPEFNDELFKGHIKEAYIRLHKISNFPEFTGRVCPGLCEKACMCGLNGKAVTVHENELFIIEEAFKRGYVTPEIPKVRSGMKVAVVGSGPAGLAAADDLNYRGHSVTVFERDEEIGGLLMFGIPNMKLDKNVIFRRKALMEEEGVVFKTGVNVGGKGKGDISAEELVKSFDAIILCCGAKEARRLNAEGIDKVKHGMYLAVDFLTRTTKALLKTNNRLPAELPKKDSEDFISAAGKNVVIVGGGDTGNDCIGTCMREGAKSVVALEMMPEPPIERLPSNPWPEWPKVKKTDYGHEEAIAVFGKDPRQYSTTVKKVETDKDGNLKKIVTVKVHFEGRSLVEEAGTEKEIPCDLLLVAAGFTGCENYTADAFKVKRTERNVVETRENDYQTNVDKVFTAGDMHRGQSLVVHAIVEGKSAAAEVDRYLMGY